MATSNDLAVNKKTLLYVGGLEENVDEKTIQGAFIPFGELVHIEMPRDQLTHHHRGFCFVEFEEPEDAAHAIENMNDSELFGRVLKVNHARSSSVAREGVWAHAGSWYEKSLKENAGEVDSMIRNEKNKTDQKKEDDSKVDSKKRSRQKEVAYVRKTGELETYVITEEAPSKKLKTES
eukprot:CAMPEP_0114521418 /NCGR_PEP_ID=MMETSP0109-20121206/20174_1 /TAXON_ID=29199 /ORGANISM="Chlorarachnion reptans, Strain CCCM449" /LENGTH=177 /DNA_ID=CAMNT_0001702519 /DNA_START=229 /DNA_END=762 /DNA_ORIENTATION=-